MPLLGLQKHPRLFRVGIRAKALELIYNADAWVLYKWQPPKVTLQKVIGHIDESYEAPSAATSAVYDCVVRHLREAIIESSKCQAEEELQSLSFSPTFYSMQFPEEGMRSLDKLLFSREISDWRPAMREAVRPEHT